MRRPVLALLLAGCGAPPARDLAVGWRFADARTCADAGAATVFALVDGAAVAPRLGFPCSDGEAGKTVTLPSLPADSGTLTLEARTAYGAPLYRGDAPAPFVDPLAVTLYFTGGR